MRETDNSTPDNKPIMRVSISKADSIMGTQGEAMATQPPLAEQHTGPTTPLVGRTMDDLYAEAHSGPVDSFQQIPSQRGGRGGLGAGTESSTCSSPNRSTFEVVPAPGRISIFGCPSCLEWRFDAEVWDSFVRRLGVK